MQFEQHATAELVISPCFASQVFLPPTPKLVLRGCGDHWLRTALLKCFRLLDCYGASSGTNYLKHYSTSLPTQWLCVHSKVRQSYKHTALHWSTPCHCEHHKLGASECEAQNNNLRCVNKEFSFKTIHAEYTQPFISLILFCHFNYCNAIVE